MAPSVRDSNARVGKRQSTLRAFGKVSKFATSSFHSKAALEEAATLAQVSTPIQVCRGKSGKRRRDDDSHNESCISSQNQQFEVSRVKKPKLQVATPPSSSPSASENEVSPVSPPSLRSLRLTPSVDGDTSPPRPSTPKELPQTLQNLISIHEVFLKALSIHYAHNGPATPAELKSLLKTTTALWKKHRIVKEDVQRMLALYEISEDASVLGRIVIEHKASPFKLTTSGIGFMGRTCVEYVHGISTGSSPSLTRTSFSERFLQTIFKANLMSLFLGSRSDSALHFLNGPLSSFPLLACSLGAQTTARQEKASVRRSEILALSTAAQLRRQPKPSIPISSTAEEQTDVQIAEKVKSRTQSLFDRIAAKQLASSSTNTPTAEAMVRRHAIGRVAEIVEILRMKQQQRQSKDFMSAVHVSPSKMRSKVSFSLTQLLQEIKGSVSIPIQEDEVRMCLKMLSSELPGFWLSMFEMGNGDGKITSVVLNGQGMSGAEVQRVLEDVEKSR